MQVGFLFARQRSGTGALGSVLGSHPQLSYLGEVFHPDNVETDRWNYFRFLRDANVSKWDIIDPDNHARLFGLYTEFLRQHIDGTTIILDVKYRSLHHVSANWKGVLEPTWMVAEARRTGAPVIHLTRNNLVETFVSGELADKNQVWHTSDRTKIRETSCTVDVGRLSSYLVHTQSEVALVEEWLQGMKRLAAVDYSEMLDADGQLAEDVAARIATVFEIEPFADRFPGFVKQAPSRLEDAIENYPLVKKALAGTPYAWMLAENSGSVAAGNSVTGAGRDSIHGDEPMRTQSVHDRGVLSGASSIIAERNAKALSAVPNFRTEREGTAPNVDQHFHKYKNTYPFFGYIDCDLGDVAFPMFSGNDDLIAMHFFWLGAKSYEPGSMKFWLDAARKSKCILDIGAFSGIYALSAATIAPKAKVHAIEPVRRTHSRLLLNIYSNGLQGRISAHCIAVSDTPGDATIFQFRGENILGNGASLVEKKGLPVESSERVSVETVDGFCSRLGLAPDLIKFDVEQLEREVVSGAAKTLKKHAPNMLIEVTPETALDVAGMLDMPLERILVVDDGDGTRRPLTTAGVDRVCNLWVATRG